MRRSVKIPPKIEQKILEYRRQRKAETGKTCFFATAINDLLAVALTNVRPQVPVNKRLDALEQQVASLKSSIQRIGGPLD